MTHTVMGTTINTPTTHTPHRPHGKPGANAYTLTHTHTHTHDQPHGEKPGANAYMLMYRQVDPDRNLAFPSDDEVPPHVKAQVAKASIESCLPAECGQFASPVVYLRVLPAC